MAGWSALAAGNGQYSPADKHHAEYYQGHANRMLMPPEPTSHPPDEISDPVRDQSTERPAADAGATPQHPESSPDGPSGDGARPARRRRRIWPIALTVLVVAFVVGAATVPLPPVYEAAGLGGQGRVMWRVVQ